MPAIAAEIPGLRERKKARTREQIREVALRLFLEEGYEATTVQQVADGAEVSLSTLFRYFPTKARLVLPFDLETLIADAFRAQGPGASVFDVIESAIGCSFDQLSAISEAAARDERASYTLVRAREALLGEATGTIGLVAQLIGERWGRDPHDPLVQSAAGSVVGVGLAAWTADRDLGRDKALRILKDGLDGLKRGFRP
jgi:AcrR family transcriptional regulator